MELELNNWYKPQVDKKELKKLSQRKDLPGLIHFGIYCLNLLAIAAAQDSCIR